MDGLKGLPHPFCHHHSDYQQPYCQQYRGQTVAPTAPMDWKASAAKNKLLYPRYYYYCYARQCCLLHHPGPDPLGFFRLLVGPCRRHVALLLLSHTADTEAVVVVAMHEDGEGLEGREEEEVDGSVLVAVVVEVWDDPADHCIQKGSSKIVSKKSLVMQKRLLPREGKW